MTHFAMIDEDCDGIDEAYRGGRFSVVAVHEYWGRCVRERICRERLR